MRQRHTEEAANWPALGLIATLHVALGWGLLQIEGVRQAVVAMAPIMVSFLPAPPKVEPPRPPPPKPRPQMIATPAPTPSVVEAPPMEAEPSPLPSPEPVAPQAVTPPDFVAAYLDNPPPVYPAASRKMREHGKVFLRVWVDVEGRPERVEIDASSGFARLDEAALDAVRRWKFVPARQGETPVPASVRVPITFELKR
jgi:periplasmic protein TonB